MDTSEYLRKIYNSNPEDHIDPVAFEKAKPRIQNGIYEELRKKGLFVMGTAEVFNEEDWLNIWKNIQIEIEPELKITIPIFPIKD